MRTITLGNPEGRAVDLEVKVLAVLPENQIPAFTSVPATQAEVDALYSYKAEAADPDGPSVAFALVKGPAGANVDSATGQLNWTPRADEQAQVDFELRAYDVRGGFTRQTWTVQTAAVNAPPLLLPIADQVISEGDLLEISFGAVDPENDGLLFWMNGLPPGSTFDAQTNTLRWLTGGASAGRYSNVEVRVWDGFNEVSQTFEILVANTNQAPVFSTPADRSIAQGQTLALKLAATDIDGDAITYSSPNLPLRATLVPDTGVFRWTPLFYVDGEYEFFFDASDGENTTTVSLIVEVLNVNGPVAFDVVKQWTVFEGQFLQVHVNAQDPDNPSGPPVVTPDGTTDRTDPTVQWTWTHSALPQGATFSAATQTFSWVPDFGQAGAYDVTFTVTDDSDGTGQATSDTVTLRFTVLDDNGDPVVDPIANQLVQAGDALSFSVTASDPDGEIPDLFSFDLPSFVGFTDNGDGSGTFNVTPELLDRGNYVLNVVAADFGNGDPNRILIGQAEFVLTVEANNLPPLMVGVTDKVALFGPASW